MVYFSIYLTLNYKKTDRHSGSQTRVRRYRNAYYYVCNLSTKSQYDTADKQELSHIDGWLVVRGLFKQNTNGLMQFGTLVVGGLLIALGLFIFQDRSDVFLQICLTYVENLVAFNQQKKKQEKGHPCVTYARMTLFI